MQPLDGDILVSLLCGSGRLGHSAAVAHLVDEVGSGPGGKAGKAVCPNRKLASIVF